MLQEGTYIVPQTEASILWKVRFSDLQECEMSRGEEKSVTEEMIRSQRGPSEIDRKSQCPSSCSRD